MRGMQQRHKRDAKVRRGTPSSTRLRHLTYAPAASEATNLGAAFAASGPFPPQSHVADANRASPASSQSGAVAPVQSPPAGTAPPVAGSASVALYARTGWRFLVDRLRGMGIEGWLWCGVLALATLLRFWGLGDKPMHHDESQHAYFSLAWALNPSSYEYNPLLHGPFQFHAEGVMFGLLMGFQHLFLPNAVGNPWINDTTARIVPALFGIGIVALPYGLRRDLGRTGALIAAFLLAVSPSFVYFSRFLREDIYFNFFMFAMVVAAVRFAHERSMRRFVSLFAATILAYATFEGIFLTFTIFVSFLAALAVWELACTVSGLLARRIEPEVDRRTSLWLSRAGLLALLGLIGSVAALGGIRAVNAINLYVVGRTGDPAHPAHEAEGNAAVLQLEDRSVAVLLWLSIAIALLVIGTLIWQIYREDAVYGVDSEPRLTDAAQNATVYADEEASAALAPNSGRAAQFDRAVTAPGRWLAGVRDRIDPDEQPFLHLLLSIPWVQWFVAFVVAWLLFAALYWVVPGPYAATIGQGFQIGIGRGLWEGLYYWMQQQQVARGGQPWYYYLLLLPLYEQLVCVFGLAGIVYVLRHPTRFGVFLAWWFVGSLVIYSWAGEKMPWLGIQILLPLVLLAAIALQAVAQRVASVIDQARRAEFASLRTNPVRSFAPVLAALGAVVLLVPMVWGMLNVSQAHAADGPHEMLVYVQTTPDVDLVMNKINHADQVLYHGKHLLRIGVGPGQEVPFYWYLRDYPNAQFGYRAGDANAPPVDVLLLMTAGDQTKADAEGFKAAHPTGYQMHQYKLRSWWDEAYKPPPCFATPTSPCPPSALWGSGVGLGNYLSYGPQAPPHARFDLARASGRVWHWLWQRQPLGDTSGSYDFVFVVRNGMPISA